ncbi:hypothetical protein Ancab_031167 [Ancistrocladus abbreviatus]
MQPENFPGSSELLYRCLAGTGAMNTGGYMKFTAPTYDPPLPIHSYCSSSSFYGYEASGISESAEAKAIAALRNHKEAEKRRRERINSHLNSLRALLPCNSKTDKATLLAKVVQRVRELKQQTSHIMEVNGFPSETDDLAVYTDQELSEEGKLILRASLCCEDRADLFSDLIDTLNNLQLKTLRAEVSTLGGRVRNVLIVSGEMDQCGGNECAAFLHDALKGVIERSKTSDRMKRRRRVDHGINNFSY